MISCNRAFTNILLRRPSYPVGDNIQLAKECAMEMAEGIKAAFPNETICLIGRGSSGLILSTLISMYIPIHSIIHIKKEGEKSHSIQTAYQPDYVHIIVDDFLNTGATIQSILDFWNTKCRDFSGNIIPIKGLCVADGISLFNTEEIKDLFHVDTLICGYLLGDDIKVRQEFKFGINIATSGDTSETSIGTFKLMGEPDFVTKAEITGVE